MLDAERPAGGLEAVGGKATAPVGQDMSDAERKGLELFSVQAVGTVSASGRSKDTLTE